MREQFDKYKAYWPAAFFVGGFIFDLVTLARIDESLQLIQQCVYLIVIGWLLIAEKSLRVESWFSQGRKNKIWIYRHEIIHFLLGSLLSVYTIFYFKSASVWNSFIFIGLLTLLFLLNEFERIKGLGAALRFGLFTMCCCSYFIYLVPIIWQHIGFFTFVFSLTLSAIAYYCLYYFIAKYPHLTPRQLYWEVVAPGVGVHLAFLILYVFKLIPPIPLSIEKMGVYHSLEKRNGHFLLHYERPWWKVWQSGAQTFVAGPQDKIHCFVSVFAPEFFREQVKMEWWYAGRDGWQRTDSIPIQIVGGRDKGFRGYTVKSFFEEGEWQIKVVTSDERELGRIYLTVSKDPTKTTHEFATDEF